MSFDVLVRTLFTDNGLSAGLAQANAGIKELEKSSPGGARGMLAVERGMASLAAQAAGLPGPLGHIAVGLLRFGGGTALVLGAVAGIGAIAEAYKLSGAEAEKLSAVHDKLAASYDQILAHGKPQVAALAEARNAVIAARKEFDKLSATVPSPRGPVTRGSPGEIAQAQDDLNAALRNVGALKLEEVRRQDDLVAGVTRQAGLEEQIVAIRGRALQTGQSEARTLSEIATVTAQQAALVQHLDAAHTATFVAASKRLEREKEELKVLEAQRNVLQEIDQISADVSGWLARGGQAAIQGIHVPTMTEIQAIPNAGVDQAGAKHIIDQIGIRLLGIGRGADSGPVGKQAREKIDIGAVAAASVAVLGAINQGGAGGILSAGGGLASSLSGLTNAAGEKILPALGPIGIGLTAVGGVLSLLSGGGHKVEINAFSAQAVQQLRESRGDPLTLALEIIQAIGVDPRQMMQQLGRLGRRGVTTRVPG